MRARRSRPGHTRNPEDGIPLRRLRGLAVHRQAPPLPLPRMRRGGPGGLSPSAFITLAAIRIARPSALLVRWCPSLGHHHTTRGSKRPPVATPSSVPYLRRPPCALAAYPA